MPPMIDIEVLRGLNERLPDYASRDVLLGMAEFVASQIETASSAKAATFRLRRDWEVEYVPLAEQSPAPTVSEDADPVEVSRDPAPESPDAVEENPDPVPASSDSGEEVPAPEPAPRSAPTASVATVKIGRFANTWTEADDDTMRDMRAAGRSWLEVGDALGRTGRACEQRWIRLSKREKTAPAPASAAVAAELTFKQREILAHLSALDDSFTPEDDLSIIEGLASGVTCKVIGQDLGCDAASVGTRWRAMMIPAIVDRFDRITIDGQRDLLIAARRRVADADA